MKVMTGRVISFIIATVMTVLSLGSVSATATDGSYKVHFFNTLEGDNPLTGFSAYSGGNYEIDSETYGNVPGFGNTFKLPSTGNKNGTDINLLEAIDIDSDTVVEFEFDFSFSDGSGGVTPNQLKIAPNGVGFIVPMGSGKIITESPSYTIGHMGEDVVGMHRYKITLKAVTDGSNRRWQIISYKADGQELLSEDMVIISTSDIGDITYFRLRYGGNETNAVVYLDNISVVSYVSADGGSPVPDKYELLNTVQKVYKNAEESFSSGAITQGAFDAIKTKITEAESVLNDIYSTSEDCNRCLENLNNAGNMINAYMYMKENGASYYADNDNAVINGDFLTDSTVTVNIPVYSGDNSDNITVNALGIIYNSDDDLFSPKIERIIPCTAIEIEPNDVKNVPVSFDLSEYTDREGLSAKVIVAEKYQDFSNSAPNVLAIAENETVITDNSGFDSTVNISKAILNDNPETEDFKITYKLKGTEGKTVALLVLKPDAVLSDVLSEPESVIEYYNTAVFDENGKAMLEFVPKSGMDYYNYIINCTEYTEPYEDKVFYADLTDIDIIIDKIYADRTLDNLEATEMDAISINTPVYTNAVLAGADIDSILEDTLSEKDYSARTLNEFTESFFAKLNVVTLFRQADSKEEIKTLLEEYKELITSTSYMEVLVEAQSLKACNAIFLNKKNIKDMENLNSVIKNAAENAAKKDNYAVEFFSTLEEEAALDTDFKKYSGGLCEIDSTTYKDVPGLGRTLKLVSDGTKGGVDILLANPLDSSKDTCMELEFDFSLSGPDGGISQNNQFAFAPNGTNFVMMRKDLIESIYPKKSIDTLTTMNEMHRYKITMQAVTANNKRGWQIISFKVDGEELLSKGMTIVSEAITGDISYVRIRYATENQGDTAYLDNISVTSYVSGDGVSPVPDKYELLETAQKASYDAEESFNEGIIPENVYETIKTRADEALNILQRKDVTTDEFNACLNALKSVGKIISSYADMNKNGTSYYVDEENSVITGDFTTDNTVTADVPVYTAAGEDKTVLKVLGFLYNDSEDLFSPMLVDIISDEKEINPGTIDNASVSFDLSEYDSRDGLSAKIVVLKAVSEIADGVPEILVATNADPEVTDQTGFANDINISKAIRNDNPETTDFKIIYKLKGEADSKASLLVLKPNADLSDISDAPDSVIEYYNTTVFDKNGRAMFEFAPQSGIGYYNYIINCDGYSAPYESKVYYADISVIDSVLDKIYRDKTLDNLTVQEMEAVSINTPVYTEAVLVGADIDSILKETISEKTYNSDSLGEFVESFFDKLNVVTLFRKAISADTVKQISEDNKALISSSYLLDNLNEKQSQNAYAYILNNKNLIKDMASLNSVITNAAANAGKPGDISVLSGGGGGSSGDSGGSGMVVSPSVSSTGNGGQTTIMQEAYSKFGDLDSVEWAKRGIIEFAARGWINGKSDGIFAPNDSITREEFVKIAVNVFGFYNEAAECNFTDVYSDAWYYKYVASASSSQIVNGMAENVFGVGSTITRQDMAVIIYRIATLCGLNLTKDGEYIPFADESLISEYAFEAVKELTKSGIISGTDNNSFLPAGLATRAEAVKMLYAAYELK